MGAFRSDRGQLEAQKRGTQLESVTSCVPRFCWLSRRVFSASALSLPRGACGQIRPHHLDHDTHTLIRQPIPHTRDQGEIEVFDGKCGQGVGKR